jgi:hypothetical protein
MFSLLKLPNCELLFIVYIYALARLGVPRPKIEPSRAIGTLRALLRPPSTRLSCHAVYILYICFVGLMLVLWGTKFPALFVYTVNHRVNSRKDFLKVN